MKLGVFMALFRSLRFEEALDRVAALGLKAVEVGSGGYSGKEHCNPGELLGDPGKLRSFQSMVESRGLFISGLSCHGNPLHPQKQIARQFHDDFVDTVLLAEKLGVEVINLFSGCPGDSEDAKYPNWPVVAWPTDFREVLEWQWRERTIPYWKEWGKFASDHHVKLAFELHGGFSVHSPATLLRLREAVGEVVGANLDPSHMFWQGIDPVQAVAILGKEKAIYHFHAKDTVIDPVNVNRYGVLDTNILHEVRDRAWFFRTVGYGHDEKLWRDIISTLRLVGYNYVLSIEHEDALMSSDEGFRKAVSILKQLIIEEDADIAYWA